MHLPSVLCAPLLAAALSLAASASQAADPATGDSAAYGPELEGFDYPHPVQRFRFTSQAQQLQMAYMDVPPARPAEANGRTAVLLHGKNFCAATWQGTIEALSQAGWRVVVPDQVGFCKSSKPRQYQYSFQQLARNTLDLLASLGIERATVIGHSTGGMLAARYALMHPSRTEHLVMVAPIGLEDWQAEGVPWISVDQWYARELKTSAEAIRRYEQATYYAGQWKPEYERWVGMLAGLNKGPGKNTVAWNSALVYDMIFTQPVVHEFGSIAVPTLLIIGHKDTTAIGKDRAQPALRERLGNYAELGKRAAAAIPGARLVEFERLGHAPQIQDPQAFHEALLRELKAVTPGR